LSKDQDLIQFVWRQWSRS